MGDGAGAGTGERAGVGEGAGPREGAEEVRLLVPVEREVPPEADCVSPSGPGQGAEIATGV